MRQPKQIRIAVLSICALYFSGCVSLQDKVPEKKNETPPTTSEATDENLSAEKNALHELELKQARLWSRIDELEGLVLKQQQRVRILEQAILIDTNGKKSEKNLEAPSEKKPRPTNEGPIKEHSQVLPQQSSFQNQLQYAQDLFSKQQWDKAFLAFSKLDRETDFSVSQGEPLYWLARCWLQMKELQTSKELFARFLEMSPQHPLVSSARAYSEEVELALSEKHTHDNDILAKQAPRSLEDRNL